MPFRVTVCIAFSCGGEGGGLGAVKKLVATGGVTNGQRTALVLTSLVMLGAALSAIFWRSVVLETEMFVSQQIEFEDGVLCNKFGFAEGTPNFLACKLDLLELRHNHEDLMAATSIP
jgi:hypothetical protein